MSKYGAPWETVGQSGHPVLKLIFADIRESPIDHSFLQ